MSSNNSIIIDKLFILLLCLSLYCFLFSSCGQFNEEPSQIAIQSSSSDFSPSNFSEIVNNSEVDSDERSEERSGHWLETKKIGNTQVTTEYFDGDNDYTVTEETISNEVVASHRTRRFLNQTLVYDDYSKFDEKGRLVSRETTRLEDGEQFFVLFEQLSTYKKTRDGKLVDNAFVGSIQYIDSAERIVGVGTQDCEIINDDRCIVENLAVYDSNGEVDHYEKQIFGSKVIWSYREYQDSSHKVIWSRKSDEEGVVSFYDGKKGGTLFTNKNETEGQFFDEKGRLIGKCVLQGGQLQSVETGPKYDIESAIKRIQEFQVIASQRDWVNEMLLQAR